MARKRKPKVVLTYACKDCKNKVILFVRPLSNPTCKGKHTGRARSMELIDESIEEGS